MPRMPYGLNGIRPERDEVDLLLGEAAVGVGAEAADLAAVAQVEADAAARAAAAARQAEDRRRRSTRSRRRGRVEDRPALGVAARAVQLEQQLAVADVRAAASATRAPSRTRRLRVGDACLRASGSRRTRAPASSASAVDGRSGSSSTLSCRSLQLRRELGVASRPGSSSVVCAALRLVVERPSCRRRASSCASATAIAGHDMYSGQRVLGSVDCAAASAAVACGLRLRPA